MIAPSVQYRRRRGAFWTLLFWGAVGIGSYVLGVQNSLGQQVEAGVLEASTFTTHPPAPLNLVSVPAVGLALVALGLLAYFAHGIRRAVVVTIVPALGILAAQLLKQRVLGRPDLFEFDAPNTFPSGHMTVFAVLVGALVWAVPARVRPLVALLGTAVLGVVGWQLLAYGWHRPSDVVGALALGVVVFAFATLVGPVERPQPLVLERTASILLLAVGGVLVAAGLVVGAFAALETSSERLLIAGQIGVIGASAVAARSLFLLSAGRS